MFVKSLHGLGKWVHHYLLPLIIIAYLLAAVCPALGLSARHCAIVETERLKLTVPMILLATLLFNAGLGASAEGLGSILQRPLTVFAGVAVNLLLPVAFLVVLRMVLRGWHDPEEAGCLLLGLAIVAAMPIAGSSTAWSQNANGNVALSLGLVLVSTLLSPITTPLILSGLGSAANDAGAFPSMSGAATGSFLLTFVVIPSAGGLLARRVAGSDAVVRLKPLLRLINALVLLFLCYSNAAVALPQVAADPDWDFLALVVASVFSLCLMAFASGWLLAKGLRVNGQDRRALMFGLGMNNNGSGMVLAASALVAAPWAIVPVLAYNLIQHIIAAGIRPTRPKRLSVIAQSI